jgi:hypothetical protein
LLVDIEESSWEQNESKYRMMRNEIK